MGLAVSELCDDREREKKRVSKVVDDDMCLRACVYECIYKNIFTWTKEVNAIM